RCPRGPASSSIARDRAKGPTPSTTSCRPGLRPPDALRDVDAEAVRGLEREHARGGREGQASRPLVEARRVSAAVRADEARRGAPHRGSPGGGPPGDGPPLPAAPGAHPRGEARGGGDDRGGGDGGWRPPPPGGGPA